MATGDSLSGDQVKIYIGDSDDVGSDFNGTNDPTGAKQYTAEVTAFDSSGGELDIESIAVFGGGFIDREKPQEQIEVTMDVIIRHGTNVDRWDALKAAAGKRVIVIQATDGTNFYWKAWNNVRVVNFDQEFAAEEEWRGTMTFKLSAATATGVTNVKYGKTDFLTGLTTWA